MTAMTREITDMFTLLPESEQNLAYEFMKRLVLAWDPDFTKLTPSEKKLLDEIRNKNEYVSMDSIDWDQFGISNFSKSKSPLN